MIWVALFSKTGSEIVEVSKRIGRWPDVIITNKIDSVNTVHPELQEHLIKTEYKGFYRITNNPIYDDYITLFAKANILQRDGVLITLHGYLRILPGFLCNTHEIYNGHPGYIIKYPELKGKDPQKRAFEGKYKTAGCVIHKVTDKVDEGEVILSREVCMFNSETLDQFIKRLHNVSIDLWVEFFNMRKNMNKKKITGNYNDLMSLEEAFVQDEFGTILPNPNPSQKDCAVEWCEKHYPETLAELKRLQDQEFQLFCKKQMDYGHTNISIGQDISKEDGKRVALSGLIFRCNDKVQRLINLVVKHNKTVAANEPIADAFSDLSLYGKIAKMVDKGVWGK
jgi:folate-dependent phosphoribosylglycinamide formyltransferase PurN